MGDKQDKSVVTSEESRPRRWDPSTVFNEIDAEMDRVFGRRLPFMQPLRRYIDSNLSEEWSPSADVFEKDGVLVVKAELPGVNKTDIEVSVDNGDLVITGERTTDEEVKEGNFFRMERFSGRFYRRFPLPDGVDEDQISAEYRDGVLEVRVPKPVRHEDESATKKIMIQ